MRTRKGNWTNWREACKGDLREGEKEGEEGEKIKEEERERTE